MESSTKPQEPVLKKSKKGTSDTESKLPHVDWSIYNPPHSFLGWIEQNKKDLVPPVGNKIMYADTSCQFKVMLVGGPNVRTDYHVEEGEEWFYMVKGDMVLKVVDGGVFRDIIIREGECFLLPANVPHSPQRGPGSIGLVIERLRLEAETDHLRWYCQNEDCREIVNDESFHCYDLGVQLKPIIELYYKSQTQRICKKCGRVDPAPDRSKVHSIPARGSAEEAKAVAPGRPLDKSLPWIHPETHAPPRSLHGWIEEHKHLLKPPVGNKLMAGNGAQFKIMVVGGPNNRTDYHIEQGEEWFYQLKGDMVLKIVDGGVHKDVSIKEGQCYLHPANVPHSPQRTAGSIGLVIERERQDGEMDGLRWYCRNKGCDAVVYEEWFHCTDLGKQLKPVIEKYYGSEELRTCKKCGTVDHKP